jgi:hypothetical protein
MERFSSAQKKVSKIICAMAGRLVVEGPDEGAGALSLSYASQLSRCDLTFRPGGQPASAGHRDYVLAHGTAPLERPVRRGDVIKRVHALHHRAQSAGSDVAGDVTQQGGVGKSFV